MAPLNPDDTRVDVGPLGRVTREEVLSGIRRLAHEADSENVRLRAWELMGRDIGMFRDAQDDGGATVIRLTPELNAAAGSQGDRSNDDD
ncbi:MAG: hypothetical protein OXH38_10500 [Chloroflexi bacterium]|nr:hypothetical protein [Chloroflexota bacterium]